ncbi:MAG: hypothetical protein RLZZ450_7667, partial [Pseudomonadota bacterium]
RTASHAELNPLSRRARLVRPLAVATCLLLSLGAGGATTALLALLVDGLSKARALGSTELLLVALGGGASLIAVLVTSLRAVFGAFRNASNVQALTRQFWVTLLAFVATLGALELTATVLGTALHHRPADVDALYACSRMAVAIAIGVAAFAKVRGRS